MNAKACFVIAFVVASPPSLAGVTPVESSAALGANDSLLWDQFGASGAQISNPAMGRTTIGIGVTVTQAKGAAYTIQNTANQFGPLFGIGERLYFSDRFHNGLSRGPVTVTFSEGIYGFGAAYYDNYWSMGEGCDVTAYDANDNVLSGTFHFPLLRVDVDPWFFGVRSTTPEIRRVVISGEDWSGFHPQDFLLGKVLLRSAGIGTLAVPALSTWGLMGLASLVALVGAGMLRRNLPLS